MNLNNFLPTIAFTFLFLLMLLYWSQAAFFGEERYKIFNNFVFLLAILSLTMLLIVRWIESGHFPLSNLYESLLFLSLCFLSLKLIFGSTKDSFAFFPTKNSFHFNSIPFTDRAPFSPNCALTPLQIEDFEMWPTRDKVKESGEGEQERALYKSKICTGHGRTFALPQQPLFSKENKEIEETNFKKSTLLEFSNLGLGVVLSPLALLTFGFAFLSLPKEMQQSTALVPALQSNWLMMHVTVMILSYAALLSGSILSIAFLILTRLQSNANNDTIYIKNKILAKSKENIQPNISFSESGCVVSSIEESACRAPFTFGVDEERAFRASLNQEGEQSKNKPDKTNSIYWNLTARLDNYSYRILALGFPLLTIGILSGAVWANEAWGSYWSWDPKETWALITWLVFAIYLHTRITKGWSGEKPAIVATLGFLTVWFCYLGVNLLGTGLHSYGWFSNP